MDTLEAGQSFVDGMPQGLHTQGNESLELATNTIYHEPSVDPGIMNPPTKTRKKKAPTLREKDWAPYKNRIIELHINEGRSLLQTKEIIENEYGFMAELRQYRTRISQWKQDKNIKTDEMIAIVRKRQKRRLVDTDKRELQIEVRDTVVESQKIDRWMKRNNISETQLYSPSPAASTPSAVFCRTISEPGTPDSHSSYPAEFTTPSSVYMASSPASVSSTLLVPSTVRSKGNAFTGQSPAPVQPPLPGYSINGFFTARSSQNQLVRNHPVGDDSLVAASEQYITNPMQFQYKQLKEQRWRNWLLTLEAKYGPSHPSVLNATVELGCILIEQGRYRSAEQTVHRAIAVQSCVNDINKEVFAPLAPICYDQSLLVTTMIMVHQIYLLGEEPLGLNHDFRLRSMMVYALLLFGHGEYREAEKKHREAQQSIIGNLGEESSLSLENMTYLAITLNLLGRIEEAKQICQQVFELTRKKLGDERPHTLYGIFCFTNALRRQWKSTEVGFIIAYVVEIVKRMFSEEHLPTLQSICCRALLLIAQGEFQQAQKMLQDPFEYRSGSILVGSEHYLTWEAIHYIEDLFQAHGKLHDAEAVFRGLTEARRRALGMRRLDTIMTMQKLIVVLREQGKFLEAEEIDRSVQELKTRSFSELGANSKNILTSAFFWLDRGPMNDVNMPIHIRTS